jgi:hypothetical protein
LSEKFSANFNGTEEEIKENNLQVRKREKKAINKESEKV